MPKASSISIRLLKTIKRFPELYNSRHDLANDKAHSVIVWDTISYELDTPVSVLKKKWQKLRSSHRKKCRSLKTSKSACTPLPRDEIFHLIYSMLDAPSGYSPGYGDEISPCSTPTLSIISEEGRSTRSSSTSTIVSEVSATPPKRRESTPGINPAGLDTGKSISNTILRSKIRATESGLAEPVENHNYIRCKVSTSQSLSISSAASDNQEKSFGLLTNCDNKPVRAFFESMALTVAKFPPHIQAATKTEICNIVVAAELELSPPPIR